MKIKKYIFFVFTFLLLIITTSTQLSFSNNSISRNDSEVLGSEDFRIDNSNRKKREIHYVSNVSSFTNDYIYNEIEPFELFIIYKNDTSCGLLRSPFLQNKNCTAMLNSLVLNYDYWIIKEIQKRKKFLDECQKDSEVNPCSPPDDRIARYMPSIRKQIMSTGYVCNCDHNKNEKFCSVAKLLNKLFTRSFRKITKLLYTKNLDTNQHISLKLHNEIFLIQNEYSKSFYGCMRHENLTGSSENIDVNPYRIGANINATGALLND